MYNEDKVLIKFRLNFDEDMKLSLNKVWSGGAGTQWIRKKSADLWHEEIYELLEKNKKIPMINQKLNLFFEFGFNTGESGLQKQLDSSNCSAMGKMIEDAMKRSKKNPNGFIVDDTSEFIGWFCLHSKKLSLAERKEMDSNYVEVTICKQ